jgi:hypothetical protein
MANCFFAAMLFWRAIRLVKKTIFKSDEWVVYARRVWSMVCARLQSQGRGRFNHDEILGSRSTHVGLDMKGNESFLLRGRVLRLFDLYLEAHSTKNGKFSRDGMELRDYEANAFEDAHKSAEIRAGMMLELRAVDKKLARLSA